MKNLIPLIVLLISLHSFSQENIQKSKDKSENVNEIKINAFYAVFGALEVTYERVLSNDETLGVSFMVPIVDNNYDEDREIKNLAQYYISPYYRFFFNEEKFASGFFVESFGLLGSQIRDDDSQNYITDFALGLGIGNKWVLKKGFLVELNLGFGRYLFSDRENDRIGKGLISIGYRF